MARSSTRITFASTFRLLRRGALPLAVIAVAAMPARAQWVTTHEQFYLQAPHNWEFRKQYQGADRLFNAFDYGHAILYETLWTQPNAPASKLEVERYDYLTRKVLVAPPHVPLEESAIEVQYARLVPEAKQMFDWAHILHRQIYDVWADESVPVERKDAEVARLVAYYKSRRDLAFSSRPKSMELMQEQPYSLAFRERYPKFNGLIWAYHWMQIGLYEPLIVGRSPAERQSGVRATVARFWQMLERPITSLPYQMPMTAAVAPAFAARYEEAAIIFDNLHSMHDVVSDILANPDVPRDRKRAEIIRAARLYRDDSSYVMPVAAWRTMAQQMGIENQGGPAVGFLPALPTPTVTYGAVMQHDNATGVMTGMKTGAMTGAHAGMDHSASTAPATTAPTAATAGTQPPVMDHAAMGHGSPTTPAGTDSATVASLSALQLRMLGDSVVRRRMLADSSARRMLVELLPSLDAGNRERMEAILSDSVAAPAPGGTRTPARRSPARPPAKPAAATPPRKSPVKPAPDPHAGHGAPPPTAPTPPVRTPPPAPPDRV